MTRGEFLNLSSIKKIAERVGEGCEKTWTKIFALIKIVTKKGLEHLRSKPLTLCPGLDSNQHTGKGTTPSK